MKRKYISKLFLIVLVLITAVTSFSQTKGTGAITGKVLRFINNEFDPVPNAKIIVYQYEPPIKIMGRADSDGNYLIENLLPSDDYFIRVEAKGFNSSTVAGIKVEEGKVEETTLIMSKPGDPEILIEDPEPIVFWIRTEINTSLWATQLSALPLGRNLCNAFFFTPNVTDSGVPGNPSVSGATSNENLYLVDGLNFANPASGLLENYICPEFIWGIDSYTLPLDAHYSSSSGGLFETNIKCGDYNEYHGELFGYFANGSWADEQKGTDFPTSKNTRLAKSYDYGLDIGGFILREKLYYFVGYNQGFISHDVTEDFEVPWGNNSLNRRQEYNNSTRSWNGVAKLTISPPISHHLFEISLISHSESIHNNEGNSLALSDLARMTRRTKSGTQFTASWFAPLKRGVWLTTNYARSHSRNDMVPWYEWQFGIDSLVNGDIGVELNPTPGFYSFSDIDVSKLKQELYFKPKNHEILIGYQKESRLVSMTEGPTGTCWKYLLGAKTNDPTTKDRLSYEWLRMNIPENPHSKERSNYFALYAQDKMEWGDHLMLNVGLRGERYSFKPQYGRQFHLDSWSPRVGISWDAVQDCRSKIFAYWGRFVEQPPLGFLKQMDPGHGMYSVSYHGEDPSDSRVLTRTNATVLPGTGNQYKEELVVGCDFEVFPNLAIGAYGQYSDLKQALDDIGNANYHYFIGNPDGTWPPVKHIWGAEHYYPWPKPIRRYKSLTLTARKRFFGNWFLNASYTLSSLKGNYNGESAGYADTRNSPSSMSYYGDIPDGTLIKNTYGFLPTDRRHVVKAQGAYQFDFGLTVGAVFLFQTGRPLNKLDYYDVGFPSYTTGYETAPIFLEPRGSAGRLPSEWSLDLRLQYTIKIRKLDYSFMVDVFNVANKQVPTELYEYQKYGTWTSIGGKQVWGLVMRRQSPRYLQVGFKISF